MPGRPPLRLLPCGLLLLSLAGCSSAEEEPRAQSTAPVQVGVPTADAVTAAVCARLVDALPEEIDPGVTRRRVTLETGQTAAWGDPPVTLQCGVAAPERPEEEVVVNGIGWSVRDVGDGFRWTTRDRAVRVSVEIPGAYDNGAELINPLSGPVAEQLPALPSPVPSS